MFEVDVMVVGASLIIQPPRFILGDRRETRETALGCCFVVRLAAVQAGDTLPSLRAQRSNPAFRTYRLGCRVAALLAMTRWLISYRLQIQIALLGCHLALCLLEG
jgi:hypothetical protein